MPTPLRDAPDDAIELIKSFEGIPDGDPSTVNVDAYIDPVGIWTIGWGHAIPHGGEFLRGAHNKRIARELFPGGITLQQAEALLRGDLLDTCAAVARLVKADISDGQFGALVSFAFNVGVGALNKSTLLRRLNAGDHAAAAEQFLVWDKGRINGVLQALPGLSRRRKSERALFLGEDWRAAGNIKTTRGRRGKATPDARVRPEPPADILPAVTTTRARKSSRTTRQTTPPPAAPTPPRPRRTAR